MCMSNVTVGAAMAIAMFLVPTSSTAKADLIDRYHAARVFDEENVARLVQDMPTGVAWQSDGDALHFYRTGTDGRRMLSVQRIGDRDLVRLVGALDLARALAAAGADGVSADSEVPVTKIVVSRDHRSLTYHGDRGRWRVELTGKTPLVRPTIVFPVPVVFSPDGRSAAFVREADLFVHDIASGKEI